MHTISLRTTPLLIAASVLWGSAAVVTLAAQEHAVRATAIAPARVAPPDQTQDARSAPTADAAPVDSHVPAVDPAVKPIDLRPVRTQRGLFASLYIGFAATQALDVHSTLRALDAGHTEANPAMRWVTSRPAAFVALKAATTTGTLLVAERLRRHHPKGALFLMAAIDSAYSIVVAKNYAVPMPPR